MTLDHSKEKPNRSRGKKREKREVFLATEKQGRVVPVAVGKRVMGPKKEHALVVKKKER